MKGWTMPLRRELATVVDEESALPRCPDRRSRGDGGTRRQGAEGAGRAAPHAHAARARSRGVAQSAGAPPGHFDGAGAGQAGVVRCQAAGSGVSPPDRECGHYSPPESRIVLRSRRVDGRLEFEVEDSGPGIDKIDMPHIFEKFYRGKKRAKLRKGNRHGAGHCARDHARARRRDRGREQSGAWEHLSLLGAAGGAAGGRNASMIRPVRRSSRIQYRGASPSFPSPTRERAPRATLPLE